MQVTYLGHAAILADVDGTRILMDPWLTDPTYHGTWWHYPPLELGPRDLPKLDYLYVSHEHPDHFDPPTLAQLNKDVHVVIANFKRKRFRDRLLRLGFQRITELDFGIDFVCDGSGLTVRLIPADRPWDDSAILLRDRETAVLNVNDCHLDQATLSALGRSHAIDLAFLTFTGASQYPGCFEFPLASKIERWRSSKAAHLEEFVNWARLLNTKRAVPAAGNHALLAEDQLFLNTAEYMNTPEDAVAALRRCAPHVEGLQMNPGDRWSLHAGLERRRPPPKWGRRMEEIESMSAAVRGRVAEYFASEAPAPADLYDRFRAYFNGVIARDPEAAAHVGIVVWWTVTGPQGGDWVIDFRRREDWVRRGAPDDWNLRMTIADKLVNLGLAGEALWENLVLSFRVRLARQPDRYMSEFWTWFCKL